MTNLLKETINDLALFKLTPKDIRWIGSRDGAYTTDWQTFQVLGDFEYDPDRGGQTIPVDLVIVGDYWYLQRLERTSSESGEGWDYVEFPRVGSAPAPITVLQPRSCFAWLTVANIEKYSIKKETTNEANVDNLPKLKFLNQFKQPILNGQKTLTVREAQLPKEWKQHSETAKAAKTTLDDKLADNDYYYIMARELWSLMHKYTGEDGNDYDGEDGFPLVIAIDEQGKNFALLQIVEAKIVQIGEDAERERYTSQHHKASGFDQPAGHLNFLNNYLGDVDHCLELEFELVEAIDET